MATRSAETPSAGPAVWTTCGTGFSCAEVTVPVDYNDPFGDNLTIALIRVAAEGEAQGTVFVNPGGPGGSGIDFVRSGFRLDRRAAQDFDLVGFDPRGIGLSTPLRCTSDRTAGPLPDLSPDDAEDRAALEADVEAIIAACTRQDAELLPHLTSANTARDLNQLRLAIGEDKLRYVGFSYGSQLGLRYAALFPDTVEAMVLDGIVDPTEGIDSLLLLQADGFDQSFAALEDACSDGSVADCPPAGVAATYDAAMANLEDGSVGRVGPTELATATLYAMYSDALWNTYLRALGQAATGQFEPIERLSNSFLSSASYTAYLATLCADGWTETSLAEWDRFGDELAARSQRFGMVLANEVRACALWPKPAEANPAVDLASLTDLPPTLIIGNTGDAATPLRVAEAVDQKLANSLLVTVNADAHTAYRRNACVGDVVGTYLTDGTVPAEPVHC